MMKDILRTSTGLKEPVRTFSDGGTEATQDSAPKHFHGAQRASVSTFSNGGTEAMQDSAPKHFHRAQNREMFQSCFTGLFCNLPRMLSRSATGNAPSYFTGL